MKETLLTLTVVLAIPLYAGAAAFEDMVRNSFITEAVITSALILVIPLYAVTVALVERRKRKG